MKTRELPYDKVVVAALAALEFHLPATQQVKAQAGWRCDVGPMSRSFYTHQTQL